MVNNDGPVGCFVALVCCVIPLRSKFTVIHD